MLVLVFFFLGVRREYEKCLPMTGIFSMMTSFAILLSRFHFSEWIQWNSSAFFLSNIQIAWVHLFCLITDSSSKKEAHCTAFIQMKWNISSKEKELPWPCPLQVCLLFLSTLNFKRMERKSSRFSTNNRENQREEGYQTPTSYLGKWKVSLVPKIQSVNPQTGLIPKQG